MNTSATLIRCLDARVGLAVSDLTHLWRVQSGALRLENASAQRFPPAC